MGKKSLWGRLRIGNEIVNRDKRWSSKKEAKEMLGGRWLKGCRRGQDELAPGAGTTYHVVLALTDFQVCKILDSLSRY